MNHFLRKVTVNMKDVASKALGIIAVAISAISIGLIILSFFVDAPVEQGVSRGFACWIFSMIIAFISVLFYVVDGVVCVIKSFMKIRPVFNLVSAVLYVGSIPMALFVGVTLDFTVIWYIYYLGIFVLEIIDIIKHIKFQKQEKLNKFEAERGN